MELVTRTLHIDAAHAAPLVSALVKHSRGNVFTARSLLMLLRNEDYVSFYLLTMLDVAFNLLFLDCFPLGE